MFRITLQLDQANTYIANYDRNGKANLSFYHLQMSYLGAPSID